MSNVICTFVIFPIFLFSLREKHCIRHGVMDPVHQYPLVKSLKKRWQTVFLALIGELLDWPTAAYGCGLL